MESKYAAPTKYDHAEYKTIWKQQLDNETRWYIQVSKDSTNPIWIAIGEFFTKIYQSCLGDGLFIDEQMDLFEQPKAPRLPKFMQEMQKQEQEILELCSGIAPENLGHKKDKE